MGEVSVKVKKLRDGAIIPRYQSDGAAGFDFHASIDKPVTMMPGDWLNVPFGIAMEIPLGYELRIRSRSSSVFGHHVVAYHGTIDSDYRGELSVLLHNEGQTLYEINPGDRVAQGVISRVETAVFTEVEELSETERGDGGFGSTGRN